MRSGCIGAVLSSRERRHKHVSWSEAGNRMVGICGFGRAFVADGMAAEPAVGLGGG